MQWTSFFQALMQTEEAVVPVFVHNPQSGAIIGAAMVAEPLVAMIIADVAGALKAPAAPAPGPVAVPPTPAPVQAEMPVVSVSTSAGN